MKASDVKHYLSSRLWVWPIVGLVVALGAAVGTLFIDAQPGKLLTADVITSDPDTARAVLSAVASAMVSVIVFTFTMTMLVVQLAGTNYSPRLMSSVLRDRQAKVTQALFVGTFAYSIVVLRAVVDRAGAVFVPELSLVLTYLLVLASLVVFILYINHVAQSVRVGSIISRVARDTYDLIDQARARNAAARSAARPTLSAGSRRLTITCRGDQHGALRRVEKEALVALARERDAVLEVLHRVGDYVPAGGPVVHVYGGDVEEGEVLRHLSFGRERTMQQDIAYGIRQLVDVANRALSPGINDPTTAIQCIDRLHEFLRRLADQPDAPDTLADPEGRPRLVLARFSWSDYLALAVTEPRLYGCTSPQIPRRLEAMLRDLCTVVASAERRAALDAHLSLLEASVEKGLQLYDDRALFERPDYQGLGDAGMDHAH